MLKKREIINSETNIHQMKKLTLLFIVIQIIFASKIFGQKAEIIFNENFKDNRNQWELADRTDLRQTIEKSKLFIHTISPEMASRTEKKIPLNTAENFEILSTITKIDGDPSKFYGLVWGADFLSYYSFLINEHGIFVIIEHKNGQNNYISKWKKLEQINPRGNGNELKMVKEGENMTFYVNEKLAITTKFRNFHGNGIGFYSSPETMISVSELRVKQANFKGNTKKIVQAQAQASEEEQKAKINDDILPITIELNVSLDAVATELKPKFSKEIIGLPTEDAYFQPLDLKEIKSHSKDNALANLQIGDIYRKAWQMKAPNRKKALKAYEKAKKMGDSCVYSRLAYYNYGINAPEPNRNEFVKLMKESAERGFPDAQYDIGIMYLNGTHGFEKNWSEAKKWLQTYANNGTETAKIMDAQQNIARMLYHEEAPQFGVKHNLAEAAEWIKKGNLKEDADLLEKSLSDFGKFRYFLTKYPQFIPEINVNINYENIDEVGKLIEQIQNYSTKLNAEILTKYIDDLREFVLITNFNKAKTNKNKLLAYIDNINKCVSLKPNSKKYTDLAFKHLPTTLDYENLEEVKKYHDLLENKKYHELTTKMKLRTLRKHFDNVEGEVSQVFDLLEMMIKEIWMREESKLFIPRIKEKFAEVVDINKDKDIKLKEELYAPKGEFETTADYRERTYRGEQYKEVIDAKYVEAQAKFTRQLIRFSYETIDLSIQELSSYDADNETFQVKINNKFEPITIPREDARSFKENYKKCKVSGEKQMLEDAETYSIFNIKITHPITGLTYYVGERKEPLFMDFYAAEDDGTGVPKLNTKVEFIEPSGNNILDAKERGQIKITLSNSGNGFARLINLEMIPELKNSPVVFDKYQMIRGIAPQESQSVLINLSAPKNIPTAELNFTIKFTEKKGFPPAPICIKIPIQKFKEPKLVYLECGISENGNKNNIIENNEIIDVTALIQNRGQGKAYKSRAIISFKDKNIINLTPEQSNQDLGTIEPGESLKINFSFAVNNNYKGADVLPIEITLKESEGLYGGTFPLGLEMKKISIVANQIRIAGQYTGETRIEDVSLTSEVDKNIPTTGLNFPNRYALVIGNEDYTKYQSDLNTEANVDFAKSDALTLAKYMEKTLGVPSENLFVVTDAISSVMESEINKLVKITEYNPESEIFFYYAGHGFPDEKTKEAYIMPVDIRGANVKAGIKLTDLYKNLTKHNPKKVTIFLDACFSGGGRNSGLLAARAIKIKPKEERVKGNLVVFAASSGDQTSLPYKEKKHGMFTFFLLKKIQETKGTVTYKDLFEYIKEKVQLNSVIKNEKDQNPELIFSREVLDLWKNWKLNEE